MTQRTQALINNLNDTIIALEYFIQEDCKSHVVSRLADILVYSIKGFRDELRR